MTIGDAEICRQHDDSVTHSKDVIDYKYITLTDCTSFQKGDTVKVIISGDNKVCIVKDDFKTSSGLQRYKVIQLNTTDNIVVAAEDVENIRPDPADIPTGPSSVDAQALTEIWSLDDLKRLWSRDIDSSITNSEIVTLYWHHR